MLWHTSLYDDFARAVFCRQRSLCLHSLFLFLPFPSLTQSLPLITPPFVSLLFSGLPFPSHSNLLQAFPMPVSEVQRASGQWRVLHLQQRILTDSSFTVLISHIRTSSRYPQPPRKVPDHLFVRNGALSGEYLLWGMNSAGGNPVVDLFCAHANSRQCTSWRIQSQNAMLLVRRGFMCSVAPLPVPHPTSALFPDTQGAQPAN